MRLRTLVTLIAAAASLIAVTAHAQATSTASRTLELSAFGGLTGTYTGLSGGRNLGVTAGVDIGIRSYFGFRPYLEGRGTYPMHDGQIDAQKTALGGIRFERTLRPHLNVYGDILIGRGEIDYQDGGYPSPTENVLYLRSTSTIFSPGVGLEYKLTNQLSILADAQLQHWDTPATTSGSLWAKPLTIGARYWFNFNRRGYPSP